MRTRELRRLACVVAVAWILILLSAPGARGESSGWGSGVPPAPSIVRLHVIAHSDDPVDQEAKMAIFRAVRDQIAGLYGAWAATGQPTDRLTARPDAFVSYLYRHRDGIVATARRALVRGGYALRPVRVEAGRFLFGETIDPYSRSRHPAGWYPALLVVVGEGRGHNWWCVVFPSLCPVGRPEGEEAGTAKAAPGSSASPEASQDAGPGALAAPATAPGPGPLVSGGSGTASGPGASSRLKSPERQEPWWVRLLPWRWLG
ncbi:stage II sporulation protein R [Carboxydochorda subterranea]|uniref:Stage II sporulation protein R n=1 Tax=Carboxydichorda subterranea TaxID=3109565 RepID=A0ABZ1C0J1_9FIRM|nr:stage II sporulation protein R [Limnochorda sp. L945t]WRP18609.1 stage II sporulation protein R [Limnochorda sp. L945t]